MWMAVLFVAITGAGTVFMVCFLIALLREVEPSKLYSAVPSVFENRWEPDKEDLETRVVVRIRHFTSTPTFMKFREAELETLDEKYIPLGRLSRSSLWLSHIRKGEEAFRYHRHC